MTHYKRIYGLTGGIATGKSTVANILKEKGYRVIDADKIAHNIILKGNPAYYEVVQEFGEAIIGINGEIDREELGKEVFGNMEKLNVLNSITHPHIMDKIKEESLEILSTRDIIFIDIPLLYEIEDSLKKYSIEFEDIILVYVNKDLQLKRLMKRERISKKEASKKIESQMSIEDKAKKDNILIKNDGSIWDLKKEVDRIIEIIEK